MNILIVDDDAAVALLIGAVLRKIVGRLETVTTFRQAKELVHSVHFDLVLLDIGLPDSPADKTILRVEELRYGGARVVILTGAWPPQAQIKPSETGADGVLYKGDVELNEKLMALC